MNERIHKITGQALEAMAADKQHWNEDEWRRNNWRCGHGWLREEQCEICNAEQEPVREALKLALTTLEGWDNHDKWVWPETALEQAKRNTKEAITTIKETLAQPAQPATKSELNAAFAQGMACRPASVQRPWVGLTDEQLRTEFGKLYPNDIGILELAENNRDFAVEAIGARHHWVAFQTGARAAETKLKERNT